MREASGTGGTPFVIVGFLRGATIYVVVDVVLERMAARSAKRTGRDVARGAGARGSRCGPPAV